MAVYVDRMAACVPNQNWKWTESCHMFADTLEELHAMAKRVGLLKAWFQDEQRLPHYDLTAAKRGDAVRNGCVEVDRHFVVAFMRARAPGGGEVKSPVEVKSVSRGRDGGLFGESGRML